MLERPLTRAAAAPAPFGRAQWLLIVAVTAVAAALRLWRFGEWSLWIDEAHTWRDATMQLAGENGFLRTDRMFYPATFLLLRFLFGVGWLGFDEASLRLPFVLLGIATVPLVALCGRRLVGPWAAVLGASLVAIDPWHLFWSQNARGYGPMVLLTVVAANRAHVWLGTDRPRDLYAAVLAIGLGALCHPSAVLAVFACVAFLLARSALATDSGRRRVLRVAVALSCVVVVVPWVFQQLSPFQGFLRSKDDPSLMHFVETVVYYFRPTSLLLAAIGLWLAPRVLGLERALLLGCLLAVPLLALAAVGGTLVKVTARYAICCQPVVAWLVALACVHVARLFSAGRVEPRAARVDLAALLPLLVAADSARLDVAYYGAQFGQRARWREAAQFVQQRAGTRGLRVLTVSHPTLLYYLRRRHWFVTDGDPYPTVDVLPLLDWMIATGEDLAGRRLHDPGAEAHLAWHRREAAREQAQFAVVVTLPELDEHDRDGVLGRALARDFELALHLPCWIGPKDASVYVYLPRT